MTDLCRLYTVVLVDVEDSLLLWMVINIPGSATRDGQVGQGEREGGKCLLFMEVDLLVLKIQMVELLMMEMVWR